MRNQRRSDRAITPILATLLLIVIAVAAIVVTYAWIMTYTHNLGNQAGVRLYKAQVNFYGTAKDKIDIDVGNSGSSDTQIVRVYLGTSPSDMQSQNIPSLPSSCAAGGITTITVNYNWTSGATYYFKVIGSTGQYLDTWPEQAPVPSSS
jgi:flagellin-like protein